MPSVTTRWEKPEQRPQPIALTPKNIASARAAEQQEYSIGPIPLLGRQSLVESLRRRLQCLPRIELRLHHAGLRLHAVDGRARLLRSHHGLMRRLQTLHISARNVLVSLPGCGLTVGDAEQRLRIGKPALDPGVEV
jgi:hypothetical protein